VLLDPPVAAGVDPVWAAMVGQPGRGPTLRIPPCDQELLLQETWAAIESVWPALCPADDPRLK